MLAARMMAKTVLPTCEQPICNPLLDIRLKSQESHWLSSGFPMFLQGHGHLTAQALSDCPEASHESCCDFDASAEAIAAHTWEGSEGVISQGPM